MASLPVLMSERYVVFVVMLSKLKEALGKRNFVLQNYSSKINRYITINADSVCSESLYMGIQTLPTF